MAKTIEKPQVETDSNPLVSKPHVSVKASLFVMSRSGQIPIWLLKTWIKRHIVGGDTVTASIDNTTPEDPSFVFESDDEMTMTRVDLLLSDIQEHGFPWLCRSDELAKLR